MATTRFTSLIAFILVSASTTCGLEDKSNKTVECYFIFGDSIVDSGNNNNLKMQGKANYLPYGIDFPRGPTGRYSNGKTIADILGEYLGFNEFIEPYTTTNDTQLLRGVNYASGYSGIRNETGQHIGQRVPLSFQLQHFKKTVSRIRNLVGGNNKTEDHMSKCLYLVVTGSNDYTNNYFLPEQYPTSKLYKPRKYADLLVKQYALHIKEMYKYGARRMALTAIPPIGCIPLMRLKYSNGSSICVDFINEAAKLYNKKLNAMVHGLRNELNGSKIAYVNMFSSIMDLFASVKGEGDSFSDECCQPMSNGLCKRGTKPCKHRSLFLYWDAIHTTQFFSQFLGYPMYSKIKKIL